ncbi:MAG TPA: YggT family protein [Chiayiivirga sp.]|nr:YggT family protein [Chiayiivirga sp.]
MRRALPAPGGLDLSPMLAMLGILLLRILLVAPLQDLAVSLAT